jgi:Schlafen, AlbA_2
MFTFSKPLDEITQGDLQRLIEDRVVESRQLEYKRELPGTGEGEKKEFVRDVVSFANSAGGHIIFGIAQSRGLPTEFVPISEEKIDDAKLRLENIIRTSVEPTIQGLKIDSVKLSSGRALLIEIPRGLFGLHMIKGRGAFITRTSAGKLELDVNEIRAAFAGAEAASARMREFRADRTAKLQNGDALWPLVSRRVGIVHLLPLTSFATGYTCAIDKIPPDVVKILYPMGKRPALSTPKFTFDGYSTQLNWGAEDGGLHGYSHLFRNGAIENVNAGLFLDEAHAGGAFHLYFLEILIMDCAERILEIMELLDIPGPYYLLLAFLNVRGLRFTPASQGFRAQIRTVDQENLILPEILLMNTDIPIESEMRSSFDMIWNACGWQRSFDYDEAGAYKENWRSYFD